MVAMSALASTTPPLERVVVALERHGCQPRRRGNRYEARCPTHDDSTPSLSVDEKGRGDVVIYCHAGCSTEGVVIAIDLTMADLFADRSNSNWSADLVAALAEIETSPWAEWSLGKPVTAPKLARLLSKYRIAPENIRFGEKVLRGYEKRAFADAWDRYLSPLESAQAPENPVSKCYSATGRVNTSENADFENATRSSCSTSQNTQIASTDAACSSVAVSKAESGSMRQTGEEEDF